MTGRLIRFKNSNVSLYNVHSFVVAHVLLLMYMTCITKKTPDMLRGESTRIFSEPLTQGVIRIILRNIVRYNVNIIFL